VFSLLGGLFVIFFVSISAGYGDNGFSYHDFQVPETKGLSLEEMDEVFGDSTRLAQTDIERQYEIQRRLGMTETRERSSGSICPEAEKQI